MALEGGDQLVRVGVGGDLGRRRDGVPVPGGAEVLLDGRDDVEELRCRQLVCLLDQFSRVTVELIARALLHSSVERPAGT
jgi:hypothetical protein